MNKEKEIKEVVKRKIKVIKRADRPKLNDGAENKQKQNFGQSGATLIEVLLASVIGLAVAVLGLYVLNARIRTTENVQVSKESENRAEEALTELTAVAPDLVDGGSFTNISDNVLTLADCTPTTCDYVLLPDAEESSKTSPAKGFSYGNPIPEGRNVAFLRRWRVETINADYGLRKITVAILKNESDTKPSLITATTVGSSKQE